MRFRMLVAASSAVLLLGGLPSPAVARSPACQLPEPRLVYSTERVVVSLVIDLSKCNWWTGKQIELSGELNQSVAGTGIGQGIAAFKLCGVLVLDSRDKRERVERTRVTRCKLRLMLDHSPVEVARYSGSFTFPWKDGDVQVPFEYDCTSAVVHASCHP